MWTVVSRHNVNTAAGSHLQQSYLSVLYVAEVQSAVSLCDISLRGYVTYCIHPFCQSVHLKPAHNSILKSFRNPQISGRMVHITCNLLSDFEAKGSVFLRWHTSTMLILEMCNNFHIKGRTNFKLGRYIKCLFSRQAILLGCNYHPSVKSQSSSSLLKSTILATSWTVFLLF